MGGVGAWAAVAFSAVFATAFAFAAWQTSVSRIGINRVLVYQYLITIMGIASGVVFFDEVLRQQDRGQRGHPRARVPDAGVWAMIRTAHPPRYLFGGSSLQVAQSSFTSVECCCPEQA